MPEDLVIRDMVEADLGRVAKLAAELVRLHHRWDERRFMLVDSVEQGYRGFFGSQLGRGDVLLRVAVRGEAIVGYLYGSLEERDWQLLLNACGALHDLYVDPAERRRGVGSALMKDALAWLEAKGAPRVVLMSAQANVEARALFEKLGFRPTMIELTREL